ncbi:Glycoprotease family protein [Anaplasma phagocytophilum]|uniref:Glycoprotease family protein n=2 Tax=Anaplasma phagocytophilum TaxID=948 RepID=A0A098EH88_ANAPH|nr:Glycoprotease family protein [Anaplasma phagocytophilum]
MKIMILNTCGAECVVALFSPGNNEFYERKSVKANHHAESLFPLIDMVLSEGGISYQNLTDIAVIIGPGSFTGLRVSLATAQGFELASGVAVHGISLLELQAYSILCASEQTEEDIVAVIESTKADFVYYQMFNNSLIPLTGVHLVPLNEVPQGKILKGSPAIALDTKSIGLYLIYKLSNRLPKTTLAPIYSRFYH